MPEGIRDPTLLNKLDKLLNEYVAKRKLDNAGDLYSYDGRGSENEFNCRFKDNCYTVRTNMGTCPCGLNE